MNYEIQGEPMPVVICQVDSGETVICESGAMSWMSPNMEMQTSGGGMGKIFGRMFSGENMFQNQYTARPPAFPGPSGPWRSRRADPWWCRSVRSWPRRAAWS